MPDLMNSVVCHVTCPTQGMAAVHYAPKQHSCQRFNLTRIRADIVARENAECQKIYSL